MEETTQAIDWSQIWIITGVGYTVVFLALLLLMYLFKYMPLVLNAGISGKIKEAREKAKFRKNGDGEEEKYLSGEISAAIAMALSLYMKEQHDEESGIITIKRVARTYSPWSSKIYGVNNNLR